MENSKTVRKGEIACNKQFLLFSQYFLSNMILIFHFKCTLKCFLQFVSIWTSLKFCRLVMVKCWSFSRPSNCPSIVLVLYHVVVCIETNASDKYLVIAERRVVKSVDLQSSCIESRMCSLWHLSKTMPL